MRLPVIDNGARKHICRTQVVRPEPDIILKKASSTTRNLQPRIANKGYFKGNKWSVRPEMTSNRASGIATAYAPTELVWGRDE